MASLVDLPSARFLPEQIPRHVASTGRGHTLLGEPLRHLCVHAGAIYASLCPVPVLRVARVDERHRREVDEGWQIGVLGTPGPVIRYCGSGHPVPARV